MLTHLDLFSGIGGFALACEWAGIETIGFVEIDKYCQKVLRKHWPDVPIVEDIRDVERIKGIVTNATGEGCLAEQSEAGIPGETIHEASTGQLGRTDSLPGVGGAVATRTATTQPTIIITAGFPCQPFSVAGKRGGKEDDRYLWPETLAVIKAIDAESVLLENVTGIINLALDQVLSDLEGAGYTTETLVIPACAVNAWHRRDRVWIVANNNSGRNKRRPDQFRCGTSLQYEVGAGCQNVTDPSTKRLAQRAKQELLGQCEAIERDSSTTNSRSPKPRGLSDKRRQENTEIGGSSQDVADPTNGGAQRSGSQCHVGRLQDEVLRSSRDTDYWAVEPELGRVAHGIPRRVDRLKCLGNAIVPQVAYEIIKVIAEIEQ